VLDTGVGIPWKRRRDLCLFPEADSSMTRDLSGTRQGLAISARLVGMMGDESGWSANQGAASGFSYGAVRESKARSMTSKEPAQKSA
jgi:hypothetical protein